MVVEQDRGICWITKQPDYPWNKVCSFQRSRRNNNEVTDWDVKIQDFFLFGGTDIYVCILCPTSLGSYVPNRANRMSYGDELFDCLSYLYSTRRRSRLFLDDISQRMYWYVVKHVCNDEHTTLESQLPATDCYPQICNLTTMGLSTAHNGLYSCECRQGGSCNAYLVVK